MKRPLATEMMDAVHNRLPKLSIRAKLLLHYENVSIQTSIIFLNIFRILCKGKKCEYTIEIADSGPN